MLLRLARMWRTCDTDRPSSWAMSPLVRSSFTVEAFIVTLLITPRWRSIHRQKWVSGTMRHYAAFFAALLFAAVRQELHVLYNQRLFAVITKTTEVNRPLRLGFVLRRQIPFSLGLFFELPVVHRQRFAKLVE